MENYQFTNNWFNECAEAEWNVLFTNNVKPEKILEIGSYEGKSICYLIEKLGPTQDLEIHAIDTWEGGQDSTSKELTILFPMKSVEERFDKNIEIAKAKCATKIVVHKHKRKSDIQLSEMLSDGFEEYFDMVYVDGSHETFDTLVDMVLSFRLLKRGGLMIVDDYLWHLDLNPDFRPKLAIDGFVNICFSKIRMIRANNAQTYFLKI